METADAVYVCARGHVQSADLGPTEGRARCRECLRLRRRRGNTSEKRKAWQAANGERELLYQRKHYLQKKYGISLAEYDKLLAEQNGVCAICQGPPRTFRHLVVDHDHKTGQVRGLLCQPCNVGLGQFEDDESRLRRALEYMGRLC